MGISDSTASKDLTVEHIDRQRAFIKRVNANVQKFRDGSLQLTRCANRDLYYYDRNDAETVIAELRRCVDEVEAAFRRADEAPARHSYWDLTIARRARDAQVPA